MFTLLLWLAPRGRCWFSLFGSRSPQTHIHTESAAGATAYLRVPDTYWPFWESCLFPGRCCWLPWQFWGATNRLASSVVHLAGRAYAGRLLKARNIKWVLCAHSSGCLRCQGQIAFVHRHTKLSAVNKLKPVRRRSGGRANEEKVRSEWNLQCRGLSRKGHCSLLPFSVSPANALWSIVGSFIQGDQLKREGDVRVLVCFFFFF